MSLVYEEKDLTKPGVSFREKVEEIMKEAERGAFTLEEFFNDKESCYYLLTDTGGYLQGWWKLEKELRELGVKEELIEVFHKWYNSFKELTSLVERLVYYEILRLVNIKLDRQRLRLIPSLVVPVAGISGRASVFLYYNPVVIERVIERDRHLAREAYNRLKMDEKKWRGVVEDIKRHSSATVKLPLNVRQGFPFIVLHELLHYALGHFREHLTDYLWEEFRSRYGGGNKEVIMNVLYDFEINSFYLHNVILFSDDYYRVLGVEEIRDHVGGKEVVAKCVGIVPKAEVVEGVMGAPLIRAGVGDFKDIRPKQTALAIVRKEDLSFLVGKDPWQYYMSFEGGSGFWEGGKSQRGQEQSVKHTKGGRKSWGRSQREQGQSEEPSSGVREGMTEGGSNGLEEWKKKYRQGNLEWGRQEWIDERKGGKEHVLGEFGRREELEEREAKNRKEILEKFGKMMGDLAGRFRAKSKAEEARAAEKVKEELEQAIRKVEKQLERLSQLKDRGSGEGVESELDKGDILRAKRVRFVDNIERAISNIVMSVEDLVGKESPEYQNEWTDDSLAMYVALRERFERDDVNVAAVFLRREPVRLKQKRIFVAIDTSGSMDRDDEVCALSIAKSIIDEMVRKGAVESVDVGFLGDADVSVLENVRDVGEFERKLVGFKMDRYGGTNMARVFEYLVEKDLLRDYSAVVIATDGETPWSAPEEVVSEVQGMGVKVAVCVVSEKYKSTQDYIRKNPDVKQWIENGEVFVLNKKLLLKEIDSGLSP